MTEIERMLSNTLIALEQELRQTQKKHEEILGEQQKVMEIQASTLQKHQRQVSILSAQHQESTQHLQRLSAFYEKLEPLLTRLNDILSINLRD